MRMRKWLSLFLSVVMVITMLPTVAVAEGEEAVSEGLCPHHTVHTEDCAYTPTVDGQSCAYICPICPVQALIDALPEAESITVDNAEEVVAKLDEIDEAAMLLSDEERDALDFAKYDAAAARLNELAGQAGAEQPVTLDCETAGGLTITGNESCYTYGSNIITITANGNFTISGTTTTDNIVVASGVTANITLNDVSIDVSGAGKSAIELEGNASVSLKLIGKNVLCSAKDHAGIRVENRTDNLTDTANTASLTINGPGSLEVHAGIQCAGIGGNNGWSDTVGGHGGIITIQSGDIKAYGGNYGAGIGGGSGGSGGNRITISGGTVYAQGAHDSTGIGGGSNYDGKFTGGTIKITGGVVTAAGGAYANSLGGSSGSRGKGDVIIDGGIVNAGTIDNVNHRSWNGIVNNSVVGNMNLAFDYTIPEGTTVTVPSGANLTIADGVTLNNNGTIVNNGTIINNGTITGNIYCHLTVTGGTASPVTEYNGKTYGTAGGTITLTGTNIPVGQTIGGWTTSDGSVTVTNGAFIMPAKALTVTAQYVNAPAYTVTIPSTVALNSTATVKAENVNVVSGSQLVVTLTDTQNFKLTTDEGAELTYSITKDGTALSENSDILTVAGGTANSSGSAELTFNNPTTAVRYSGAYKGTVTFTVSIEEVSTP